MKIGILTQPLRNNYGGLLQNYAMQQVLIKNGHQPITLDWRPYRASRFKMYAAYIKTMFLRLITKNKNIPYPCYQPTEREEELISINNREFIEAHILHSKTAHNSDDFRRIAIEENIEGLVVGSDQVWRPLYNGIFLYDMFFRFAKGLNMKKIAYAVSFGTDKWEYSRGQTAECMQLVQKFDLVTVREETGIKLCNDKLNIPAQHVLDPTLLLDKTEYQKLIIEKKESKGKLFYYILDSTEEKMDFIQKFSSEHGYSSFTCMPKYPVELINKDLISMDIKECTYPSVIEWIQAFDESEFVICDSFHGCVFSIIFNKPFWVLANKERGMARFESLLKIFGLTDRLIDPHSINLKKLDSNIDWSAVENIKRKMQLKSTSILLSELN